MGQVFTVLSVTLSIIVIAAIAFVIYKIYAVFSGHGEGTPCGEANNMGWPASGCDISAGHCCWTHPDSGQCHLGACLGAPTGAKCTVPADCLQGDAPFGTQDCNPDGICVVTGVGADCKKNNSENCGNFSQGKCCWTHPNKGECTKDACLGAPTGGKCVADSDCLTGDAPYGTQKCSNNICIPNGVDAVCPCVIEGTCPDGNSSPVTSGCGEFPTNMACCNGKCAIKLVC